MRLEARLTGEDLRAAVTQLAPVHVRLGEDGELVLGDVSEVALVPGKGVRIVCKGQLHWSVLGLRVPVTLESLAVAIEAAVETTAEAPALVFRLAIERADLAMIPQGIADHLTERVNKELAAKGVGLSWPFVETLSHAFPMPGSLVNIESFGLRAVSGSIEITGDALVFAVSFVSEVGRRAEARA